MFRTRSFWAAGLLIVLGPAAMAADQTPEEVLKSRGLTKSGTLYVLDAEADFLEKFAKVQPLYLQTRELHNKLLVIVQYQSEYDEIDNRYTLVTEQLRNVQAEQDSFPPTSNNVLKQQWQELLELERQLRIQRSGLDRELNLRYKNLVPDWQKEKLSEEFQKRREDFLKETREPRALADKIKKQYGELSKDEAVRKALGALRLSAKARLDLGPTLEFKRKSTQLKNAETEVSPVKIARKTAPKKARIERKTKNTPKGKRTIGPDSGKTGDGSNF